MPFAYDRNSGDLVYRDTLTESLDDQAVTLAKARRYGGAPDAAGMLHRALGPVRTVVGSDPYGSDSAYDKARRQLRRALATLGAQGLDVEAVVGALDDDWQLVLRVRDTARAAS